MILEIAVLFRKFESESVSLHANSVAASGVTFFDNWLSKCWLSVAENYFKKMFEKIFFAKKLVYQVSAYQQNEHLHKHLIFDFPTTCEVKKKNILCRVAWIQTLIRFNQNLIFVV